MPNAISRISKLHEKIYQLQQENKRLRYEITKHPFEKTPVEDVVLKVSELTGVTPMEMRSKSRKREYVIARQVVMWIIYQTNKVTWTEIGKYFLRDHSTVIHSVKSVDNALFWPQSNEYKIIEKYDSQLLLGNN
jgi:chromosomal replication initiation ATPase DnaA